VRLHIQNPEGSALAITAAQWESAVLRHPLLANMQVSIGSSERDFADAVEDAEVLLTWVNIVLKQFAPGALPNVAPRLRIIHANSAGVDRLHPFAWLPYGIKLINNSGIQSEKVGEFAIMALLMLQNHMPALIRSQQNREWNQLFGTTLRGRHLCVVGVGALGSGVARQAHHFGMHMIGVRNGKTPHPDFDEIVPVDEFDAVLPRIDDLILACPLTPTTRNLLSKERLARLRKGTRVLNIARGAVWDEEAVCDALDSGHLESAFTDVTVVEPLPGDHRMWHTPGMIVTPHISADDREHYNDRTLDILAENLAADLRGDRMPNLVDPVRGY
jgi:phosphoglycerate dehydrogenase-like enzyme